MTNTNWKDELKAFFDQRGDVVSGAPTIDELCFIAGRDPRLWRDATLLADLKADILTRIGADSGSHVLEVGCAAGFLAHLIAPAVGAFVGIDLAEGAVGAARKLGLANATFEVADGEKLRFKDNSFDAAFCYDVFSNFPSFSNGAPLIAEMVRVVRPGGRVLVGSVPDDATKDAYVRRIPEVAAYLERRHGPPVVMHEPTKPVQPHASAGRLDWLRKLVVPQPATTTLGNQNAVTPQIVNYYFKRDDFVELGATIRASVEITHIHALNPYQGYRFNAIYRKTP